MGYGSLLGATENMRLQGKLGRLTWVIVLLTIVITIPLSILSQSQFNLLPTLLSVLLAFLSDIGIN